MNRGALAVALVQRQVMIVQVARSHKQRDPWLDVYTYTPFGDRVFLASTIPQARIASSDILTIFPSSSVACMPANDMLELPAQDFSEFMELRSRNQKRYENLWSTWKAKFR